MIEVPNVSIREAGEVDAEIIARVNLDTWRQVYVGLLPKAYLENLSLEKRVEAHREQMMLEDQQRFVAENPQKALGYAAVGKNRVPFENVDGELQGLYVLGPFQKMGLGNELFKKSVEWLKDNGYKSMLVWVLKDNQYQKFYKKFGAVLHKTPRQRVYGGKRLNEVCYIWKNISEIDFS